MRAVCHMHAFHAVEHAGTGRLDVQHPAGTPLEASKRKVMVPFLYLQVVNWVVQVGALGEAHVYVVEYATDSVRLYKSVFSWLLMFRFVRL